MTPGIASQLMTHSKALSDAFRTPTCPIDTVPLINAWVYKRRGGGISINLTQSCLFTSELPIRSIRSPQTAEPSGLQKPLVGFHPADIGIG